MQLSSKDSVAQGEGKGEYRILVSVRRARPSCDNYQVEISIGPCVSKMAICRARFTTSPRLNLRLLCTTKSPVRRMLDIWTRLPLVISNPGEPVMTCFHFQGATMYVEDLVARIDAPRQERRGGVH